MNVDRIRSSIRLLVVAALVAGCGGTSSGAPATSESSLAPRPTVAPTEAVALAMTVDLAGDWQSVEMTEAALTDLVKQNKGVNDTLAKSLEQLLSAGLYKSITIYAFGYTGVEQIGNLVGTTNSSGRFSLAVWRPVLEGQFKQLGASNLHWTTRTLAAGSADVIDLLLTIKATDQSSFDVNDRVFNVIRDGFLYQLTFTCYPAEKTKCLADADTMATSWKIGP